MTDPRSTIETFIRGLPKAELHVHIEGTLEPELAFKLAHKHGIELPYATIDELRAAYRFGNLQEFLDVYYTGMAVLLDEEDFHDLSAAYLAKAHEQGVVHVEIFFDPQAHRARGVEMSVPIRGIRRALVAAEREFGITSRLILCFLRHLSADDAMQTLLHALAYKEFLAGVGLDSSELGHPPAKFAEVFARARREGLSAVAHAGEEGPPAYIYEALDILQVRRIDHGVRCEEDPELVRRLARERVPLTVCPLSNVKLNVYAAIEHHNFKRLFDAGLCLTVNSDDPAYFGGYILENYLAVQRAFDLSRADLSLLARNSFEGSFLSADEKHRWSTAIDTYVRKLAMPVKKPRIPIARPRDCTFAASDWDILAQCWFPIAVAAELPAAPIQARLLDVDLVVFHSHEKVVVARDLCPHRGMLLSRGWVDDGQIICPYHGLHFSGDGRCTSIPSRPDARISDRLSLTVVPSVERFGLIWATLAGEDVRLPRFEAWDQDDFQNIVCRPIAIAGSTGRQIEGFLDVAHFAWAHTGTFGNRANPVVPEYTVDRREHGLTVNYLSNVSNYGPDQSHRAPADFVWRRTFDVFPPFTARLIIDYPDHKQLWILNAACPVSARHTRLFCPIARNFDKETSVEALREFNDKVFNEDRVLVESQKPEDLPLDLGSEISIPADRTSVEYRRLLKQMNLSLVYSG